MQLTITDVSPVEKTVQFEIPWQTLEWKLNKRYKELAKTVRLPGFRPGKTPVSVVQRIYRKQIEQEVKGEVIRESIQQATTEKQIDPASPPLVQEMGAVLVGGNFKFSMQMDVLPDIQLGTYTGVEVTKEPTAVTDSDIDTILGNYQHQFTELKPVTERKEVALGDTVRVTMTGKVGGEQVNNPSATLEIIESKSNIPGLIKAFVGMHVGPDQSIRLKISHDHEDPKLAGTEVRLHVEVHGIYTKAVPPIDDELAKSTGEHETLEGLRERIRARLGEKMAQEAEGRALRMLVQKLVEQHEFPVPPVMLQNRKVDLGNQLRGQVVNVKDPKAREAILEQLKAHAEKQATLDIREVLLLKAIGEREKIAVGDADLQKYFAEVSASSGRPVKDLQKQAEEEEKMDVIKANLLQQLTVDWLWSQAKVSEPSAPGVVGG